MDLCIFENAIKLKASLHIFVKSTYTIFDIVPTRTKKIIMMNIIRKKDTIDALAKPTKFLIRHRGEVMKSVAIPITKSRRTKTEVAVTSNNLTITLVSVSPTMIL